jgi:transposase
MVGVDVGKAALHFTWMRGPDGETVRQGQVANTPQGIAMLLARTEGDLLIEPTGRYGLALVQAARAGGREVFLLPTRRARLALQLHSDRAKTDRVDSEGLALCGLYVHDLRPYPLPSLLVDTVRQLERARALCADQRARLRQQQADLPLAAAALQPLIDATSEQLAAIERTISQAVRQDATMTSAVSRLQRVPGIGPVTSTALAVCLTDRQFGSADQFVAYIGLDIQTRRSGSSEGRGHLSKRGDPHLRRLLFTAAMAACRKADDPQWLVRYRHERAKGMSSTAAFNVVARKLARLAWSLVAHGTEYAPERVTSPTA